MTDITAADKRAFVQCLTEQYPPHYITTADVPGIIDFENEVFPENPFGSTIYWNHQAVHLPEHTELIVVDGLVAACAHTRLRPSRMHPGRVYGEITSLGMRGEYRGQGLGSFLLHRSMDRLLEADPTGIALQTSVNNFSMQGLALKAGFTIEDTLPDYYRTAGNGREDAYSMIYRRADADPSR